MKKMYKNDEKEPLDELDEDDKNINKYTNEDYFNKFMAKKRNYVLCDRKLEYENAHKIEVMDLYKDNTAFSVKIGNNSGKLSYVVDQSLEGIRYIKNHKNEFPKLNKVCIWLILTRKSKILDENGDTDINKLNCVIFKNKLDNWKKEVLLMGYTPIIRVNYKYSGNYMDNLQEVNPKLYEEIKKNKK